MDFQNLSAYHYLQVNAEKMHYWTLNLVEKYQSYCKKTKNGPKSGLLTVGCWRSVKYFLDAKLQVVYILLWVFHSLNLVPIVCDIYYSVSMLCFYFKVPHSSFRDSVNFNGYSQRYVYHRVMRFEHCLCAMSLSTLRPFGLIDCDSISCW